MRPTVMLAFFCLVGCDSPDPHVTESPPPWTAIDGRHVFKQMASLGLGYLAFAHTKDMKRIHTIYRAAERWAVTRTDDAASIPWAVKHDSCFVQFSEHGSLISFDEDGNTIEPQSLVIPPEQCSLETVLAVLTTLRGDRFAPPSE